MAESQILDLHGYTRERAIEKLTFFLDQIRHKHLHSISNSSTYLPPSMPVTIITGSGKHSQSGPVLRHAVEKTLTKRQMVFRLNHGKGSFIVDAFSGIELRLRRGHGDMYDDDDALCPKDTKVVIKRRTGLTGGQNDIKLVNRPKNTLLVTTTPSTSSLALTLTQSRNTSSSYYANESSPTTTNTCMNTTNEPVHGVPVLEIISMPTPSEALQDEEQLQDAKQLSEKEASRQLSLETKETNKLQKATEDSIRVHREVEKERKILSEILELSKKEEEQQRLQGMMSEEEMIEQALKLSQQMEKDESEQERLELERVLELSQKEKGEGGLTNVVEEEEDLMLMEALNQSKALAMDVDTNSTTSKSYTGDSSSDVDAEFERQLKIVLEESARTV